MIDPNELTRRLKEASALNLPHALTAEECAHLAELAERAGEDKAHSDFDPRAVAAINARNAWLAAHPGDAVGGMLAALATSTPTALPGGDDPEPDMALLASMATCIHHDFGLLDARRQEQILTDMRKLWNEVAGRGYYSLENRGRYIAILAAGQSKSDSGTDLQNMALELATLPEQPTAEGAGREVVVRSRDGNLLRLGVDTTEISIVAARPSLHPATADLVSRFSAALADKLAAAEVKYGYSDGWLSDDWMDECRQKLNEHVAKGDPRDVAAFCAFLWHHGERTALPAHTPQIEPRTALGGERPGDQLLADPVPRPDTSAQGIQFSLREAVKLVEFFGGSDTSVTVVQSRLRMVDGELLPEGLYAHCTEYPEEGAEYLGPVEVQDEDDAPAASVGTDALSVGDRVERTDAFGSITIGTIREVGSVHVMELANRTGTEFVHGTQLRRIPECSDEATPSSACDRDCVGECKSGLET